jgi:hypothetical protein
MEVLFRIGNELISSTRRVQGNQELESYFTWSIIKEKRVDYIGQLPKLLGQLGKKYFDYSAPTTRRKIF